MKYHKNKPMCRHASPSITRKYRDACKLSHKKNDRPSMSHAPGYKKDTCTPTHTKNHWHTRTHAQKIRELCTWARYELPLVSVDQISLSHKIAPLIQVLQIVPFQWQCYWIPQRLHFDEIAHNKMGRPSAQRKWAFALAVISAVSPPCHENTVNRHMPKAKAHLS